MQQQTKRQYNRLRVGTTFVLYVITIQTQNHNVVTPLRKAASYEPRIASLEIWGDTWLTRGKYDIYVVVTGPLRGLHLRDAFWKFCHVKSTLSTVVSPTSR